MKAKAKVFSVALSPAPVLPGSSEQLFLVAGVKLGDFVAVNKPTTQAGLSLGGARASANGQIGLTFANDTGSPITPTPGEFYTIFAASPEGDCDDDHGHHCCDDDDDEEDDD